MSSPILTAAESQAGIRTHFQRGAGPSCSPGANTTSAYVTQRSAKVTEVAPNRSSRVLQYRQRKNGRCVTKTKRQSLGHQSGMRSGGYRTDRTEVDVDQEWL